MPVSWADVSYYQPVVDDTYPHPVLCIRSNDGTFRDPKFGQNYAWAQRAISRGRLHALIVYTVYRPNWEQTADVMIQMLGTPPHPKIVAMIDVESWGGQISGNHSDKINAMYRKLAAWLGDPRRVIGYGNRSDLNSLWPQKPEGIRLVVASYPNRPSYSGMIAHQFSSSHDCVPFGPCDANIAYDHDLPSLLKEFGLYDSGAVTPLVLMDEDDDVDNIFISGTGRRIIGCPTGSAAENRRRAWLSAIVIDLHGPAWVQVFAQGDEHGIEDWRWTEKELGARPDNLLPRARRVLADGTSHLIVSWDLTKAPEGGTLLLETRPTV